MKTTTLIFFVLAYFSYNTYANVIKPRPDERITHGRETIAIWTAAIIRDDGRYCAGALISDQFILTSAFCVDNQIQVEVILGATNISDPNENNLRFISRDVFIHEEWDPRTLRNDIALIKLPEQIQITEKIMPIKLPTAYDDRWDNYQISITGWGETENKSTSGSYSNIIRVALADGRPSSVCAKIYPKYFNKTAHFCFGGTINGTMCAGDEGGPAFYDYEGASGINLVGIASFRMAQSCATQTGSNYPGVYTSVYWFLDWIEKYVPL